MTEMTFAEAIEAALAQAMAADQRVVVFGEDAPGLRMNLYARFGEERVRSTPISEAAFVGAAVGAAMAGLRPVVEVMLVDFVTVAADALVNHAAKVAAFSGGDWQVPLVVRAACGGGYGDGGQHEQALWGMLAGIPGLLLLARFSPWGVREPSFTVEPPRHLEPLSAAALALRASLAGGLAFPSNAPVSR